MACNGAWTVDEKQRPTGILVSTAKHSFAFAWGQFTFAHGHDSEVRAFWTTHVVTFSGSGLKELLNDIALQRVSAVTQSPRTARFAAGGPVIDSLEVTAIED